VQGLTAGYGSGLNFSIRISPNMKLLTCSVLLAFTAVLALPAVAQTQPMTPDIPPKFASPHTNYDYVKRIEMVPMRDGVRLYTVIVVPKGAHNAPILLTRTPYNAGKRAQRKESPHMLDELPEGDEVFVRAGYIRVFQDVRGKYGSEGEYVMTPPPTGPLNPDGPNDTKDAYDTIDWLVKNVPESNGRVGMLGSSYEGFTVVMALLDPHPALKVAAPESPMIDGWMGDDWFHYGAFRQNNLDYFTDQTTLKREGEPIPREGYDDYSNLLHAGSAGDFAPRTSSLRRVLAGAGVRQSSCQDRPKGPHHVGAGFVGSGRHVGRNPFLRSLGAEGSNEYHELPGDGSLASQSGQLRWLQSRSAALEWKHHSAVSP
jgi:predicted acyl esterase